MSLAPDLTQPLPRLLYVTDPARTADRELVKVVELVLKGGCKLIQIRAPGLSDRAFYLLARQLTHLANGYGALSIINDRIDICHAVGAQGVHLGGNDMPVRVARQLLGPYKLLGYSAHQLKEVRRAPEDGADYLTFSPICPLRHKKSPFDPWGPHGYHEALLSTTTPVFALGGITAEAIPALLAAAEGTHQCARIAAVSLLSEAESIQERTRDVARMLHPESCDEELFEGEARYTFEPEDVLGDDPPEHYGGGHAWEEEN
ncbi:MAG: thiamine phosphate synthase [bacterium]